MTGYTRTMITCGFISGNRIKEIVKSVEAFGYHGLTKIHLLRKESSKIEMGGRS